MYCFPLLIVTSWLHLLEITNASRGFGVFWGVLGRLRGRFGGGGYNVAAERGLRCEGWLLLTEQRLCIILSNSRLDEINEGCSSTPPRFSLCESKTVEFLSFFFFFACCFFSSFFFLYLLLFVIQIHKSDERNDRSLFSFVLYCFFLFFVFYFF